MERGTFLQNLKVFVSSTEAQIREVTTQCNMPEKQSKTLYEYFGEDPGTASSARILSTLWKFLQRLGQSTKRYEQWHGPFLTPKMLEEEDEGMIDYTVSTGSSGGSRQQQKQYR